MQDCAGRDVPCEAVADSSGGLPRAAARSGVKRLGGLAATVVLALALVACAEKDAGRGQAAAPPPVVSTLVVAPRTAALARSYPARVQAINDVEVRAQVSGILRARNYEEGSSVQAGATLFEIDPAPYEARLQQADAERERARAQLRQAQRDWQRMDSLFKSRTVSAHQHDEARSALELAQSTLANAEASRRTAQINLGYTKVAAPIAGVTGLQAVSPGNLVEPGTLLTTIRQLDPVHVLFSTPEADALMQRRQFGFVGAAGKTRPHASVLLPDGSKHDAEGEIDYMAASVEARTGTVQVRAVFPNRSGILVPGQFVRIAVLGLTAHDAIVVPARAIVESPLGPSVYVLDDTSTAQVRPVRLGDLTDDGQIISEGLATGDKIVVGGIAKVKPGMVVTEGPGDGNGNGTPGKAAAGPATVARAAGPAAAPAGEAPRATTGGGR